MKTNDPPIHRAIALKDGAGHAVDALVISRAGGSVYLSLCPGGMLISAHFEAAGIRALGEALIASADESEGVSRG